MSAIRLYGVPFSQPVRSTIWMLLIKEQNFDLVPINPGSKGENGSRNPAYLAKSPGGTIPCLEEVDSGFTLGESHAIMTYLCQQHGWTDLYPDDLQARAKVDWYLNFHHRNIRDAAMLVAPRIRKDLNIPDIVQHNARRTFEGGLRALEGHVLSNTAHVAGDALTIADLAAYGEIGQLQQGFTNLFDFSAYPNVQRWLDRMRAVKYHDEAHIVLSELGDISTEPPTKEQIISANINAIGALGKLIESFS